MSYRNLHIWHIPYTCTHIAQSLARGNQACSISCTSAVSLDEAFDLDFALELPAGLAISISLTVGAAGTEASSSAVNILNKV